MRSLAREVSLILVVIVAGCSTRCRGDGDAVQPSTDSGAVSDTGTQPSESGWDAGMDSVMDSAIGWRPVPGGDRCGLFEADPSSLTALAWSWSACGEGCRVSQASPWGTFAATRSSAAGSADGLVLIEAPTTTSVRAAVMRLTDNRAIAAIDQRAGFGECGLTAGTTTAGWLAYLGPGSGFGTLRIGRVATEATAVTWSPEWVEQPAASLGAFATSLAYGQAMDDGTIRVFDASLKAFTVLSTPTTKVFSIAALGDFVAWSALDASSSTGNNVIRASTPSRGTETYVTDPAADLQRVALSDGVLSWIGVHGPDRASGRYTAAEMYWSKLPSQPSEVAVVAGPALPATRGLLDLRSGGDYAATLGCNDITDRSACELLVVQRSTKRLWRIRPREKKEYAKIVAVTATEVLVGEVDWPVVPAARGQIGTLLRLDVAKLDVLAAR